MPFTANAMFATTRKAILTCKTPGFDALLLFYKYFVDPCLAIHLEEREDAGGKQTSRLEKSGRRGGDRGPKTERTRTSGFLVLLLLGAPPSAIVHVGCTSQLQAGLYINLSLLEEGEEGDACGILIAILPALRQTFRLWSV